MRKLILGLFALASAYLPFEGPALAQVANQASVLSSCGSAVYPAGTVRAITQDTTGTLCTASGGAGGGGTSSNFGSAFPTAGTAAGFLNSAGTLMEPGNLDASGNLKVLATQTGTWNINNISGTISLPTGAATAANQATEITSLATIATNSGLAIPAGTAIIGKVGIDQTTPGTTNGFSPVAAATGGTTPFTLTAANSTNATNIKASAGLVDHVSVYNISATPAWVSFYDTASTPTCGTGIKYQVLAPANSTSGAGAVEDYAIGVGHASGIGICFATGIAGTGAVAASSYVVNVFYK